MKLINLKRIFIILLIGFSVIFHQCKESDPGIVVFSPIIKGQVIDELTKEPLDETMITIGLLTPDNSVLGEQIFTNKDGMYLSNRYSNKIMFEQGIYIEASKYKYARMRYFSRNMAILNDNGAVRFYGDTIICNFSLTLNIDQFRVNPDTLNFRKNLSSLSLTILNTSSGKLDWGIVIKDNWISSDKGYGQIASNEFSILEIKVNRLSLIPGNHSSTIEIRTNIGQLIIPVYVSVN